MEPRLRGHCAVAGLPIRCWSDSRIHNQQQSACCVIVGLQCELQWVASWDLLAQEKNLPQRAAPHGP